MTDTIILASGSEIRRTLLQNAGVICDIRKPMVDEESILASLVADGAKPRDIADTLAEHKARKVGLKAPDALVIGCDQVLDLDGNVLQKPRDQQDARDQLLAMSGNRHSLLSAAVIYHQGKPLWRHIGVARLQMRQLSETYLDSYIDRNWDSIRHSVGCYELEEEGARLFSRVDGDYFTVLGLPLVELLRYLTLRGALDG